MRPALPIAAALAASAALAAPARADPSPWQGSQFSVRQEASTVSFRKSAEPTWNPYWLAALDGTLKHTWHNQFFARGRLAVARELTNSDVSTMAGEWWLSDTYLALGGKAWSHKGAGVAVTVDGQVQLPTSKVSKGRSLIAAPSLGVGVAWQREATGIGGVVLGLKSRGGPLLHEYTTLQFATPWLGDCAPGPDACGQFRHSGLRNPRWRFQNALQVGWMPLKTWTVQASAGVTHDLLYPVTPASTQDGTAIVPSAGDPDLRVSTQYGAGVTWSPVPGVDLALALEAAHNVLRPDSTYQLPLFNRYAAATLELAIQPDRIAELLQSL